MRRLLPLLLLVVAVLLMPIVSKGQNVATRANVIPYYDEAGIEKNAYRQSPYYMELGGNWKQKHTDTSTIYTRQIDVDKGWRDFKIYLNVRAGHGVRVTLNGKEIGYADDSRCWNEFLLNERLRYGKQNTLGIETLKCTRGSLLEDTANYFGLNGEPYIVFKNDPNISDITLVVDYDAQAQTGSLILGTKVFCGKRKGKYYVEVELWSPDGRRFDRMGRWVVFNGKNEETVDITRSWNEVEPWSAERPTLYTAVVRLRNEKMEEEETVGTRFGFRRVEVKDGVIMLNGNAIIFKGADYGINHTEGNASREQMRRDVETMKRANINAVRTTRFSPMDPFFYELCDQYGLYVVCDANLLPLSEQHKVVATDNEYIPLFEQRVTNMYGKYKNHSCIVAWSLGNSRDNGVCMTAAYKQLKALDKTRPVVFSGAEMGESTDIIAPTHPSLTSLKQLLAKQKERPFVVFSAVGVDDFSDIEDLWQTALNQRQLQGCFVDYWALSADRRKALKQLFSPFRVSLSKITTDNGEFVVSNLQSFENLSRYLLEYNVYTNLRPSITGGDLPMAVAAGSSEKESFRLPQLDLQPGEEMFVRFDLSLRRNDLPKWRGNDLKVGTEVFSLPQKQAPKSMIVNNGQTLPDSTVARIPLRLYFKGHADYMVDTVDRLERRPDERTLCIDEMLRYVAPGGVVMCDVRLTYTIYSTGDCVADYTFAPTDRFRGELKPVVCISEQTDSVRWFGLEHTQLLRNGHCDVAGIYSAAIKGSRMADGVRWAAIHTGYDWVYATVCGVQCFMDVNEHGMELESSSVTKQRVHLRRYDNEDPSDFMAMDFPEMALGMTELPAILSSERRFYKPLEISISSARGAEVHYTIDGSEPTLSSPVYKSPFTITTTTVVKARAWSNLPTSFTATRKFNFDHIVSTTFSRKPNTPYNVGTDTILFDGDRGVIDDFSRGWLGFSGPGVATTVQLAKPIDVEYIVLRYAHSPATWAFAPTSVSLLLSTDSATYSDTVIVEVPFDPADQIEDTPRVVELRVPVDRSGVTNVCIEPATLPVIPQWHRAKGLKPWLMMDEIEVIEK